MKCEACGKDDVVTRRRMVDLDDDGIPIRHHECQEGHRFHSPVDATGAAMKQSACDCAE